MDTPLPATADRIGKLYQVLLLVLIGAAIWLAILPDDVPWLFPINLVIWLVFLADYLIRLVRASDRRSFVRSHVLELLAAVPWDFVVLFAFGDRDFGLGPAFRLPRILLVLRAGTFLFRMRRDAQGILATNGFGRGLLFTVGTVIAGGLLITMVEPEIGSPGDGIWWGVVTATTVGYGDISPKTPWGRLVAAVLMLVGIGTFGLYAGTVATYFLGRQKPVNHDIEHVIAQLERWDELTPEERRRLAAILQALANT